MPERVQRKRTKGWRMPENTVYVGRPTRWGNPYKVGQPITWLPVLALKEAGVPLNNAEHELTLEEALNMYLVYISGCIKNNPDYYNLEKLRGKDLVCWCSLDVPCHATMLLTMANAEKDKGREPGSPLFIVQAKGYEEVTVYMFNNIFFVRMSDSKLSEEDRTDIRKFMRGQTMMTLPGVPLLEQDYMYLHDYDNWRHKKRTGREKFWD